MGYKFATPFPPQFEDANGNPLVGGTVEFYIWNTSTPTPIYSDTSGTSLGTSLTLNALGQPQSSGGAAVNLAYDESVVYKIIRKDASGNAVSPTIGPFSVSGTSVSVTATGGTLARTLADWFADRICIFSLMTAAQVADVQAGTLTLDVATAVQNIINAMEARGGGTIYAPNGFYLLNAVVLMKRGVKLEGMFAQKPGASVNGVTAFVGKHTGAAVLSLKGAHCCSVRYISLIGDQSTTPKTGLLLGRDSASSAGLHTLERVNVEGYFSSAAIYSIASESNVWLHCSYTLLGGGGAYGFYTSQGDELSVDSLTGSSNLANTLVGMDGINAVNDAGAIGIYVRGGGGTGTWNFIGCYVIQARGDYIRVDNGSSDGQITLGPITFTGTSGEIYDINGSNSPVVGFDITGTVGIYGLTINGGRFQFRNATGNERSFKQGASVTMYQPTVNLQAMDNATAELVVDNIIDGHVSVGTQTYTAPGLTNSWANTYALANGLESAGYIRRPDGYVMLKGTLSGGVVGSPMFTLPAGYRPANTQLFTVLSNDALGKLSVNSNGEVTLQIGNNTYASLDGISFKHA